MNTISAWFRSKNITTHTIAIVVLSVAGFIAADPQAQALITQTLAAHPAAASEIVGLALIIAKYSHSSSPAGTVATSRNILANGNAPTAAQVDAADVKAQ